jgi:hypothetical protein
VGTWGRQIIVVSAVGAASGPRLTDGAPPGLGILTRQLPPMAGSPAHGGSKETMG